jgi:hypothetical protein
MIYSHQPGSEPIDIPEAIPNPVALPERRTQPAQPQPQTPAPVKIPEKVPAG